MKYYKIIQGNSFIGVVNSNNFIYYHPYDRILMAADEILGQYIEYHGKLYRDTWMAPTPNDIEIAFEQGFVIEISQDVYEQFREAIENDEVIDDEEPEPIVQPVIPNPIEEVTVEFMRESKIAQMSTACRATIESGFDIILNDGESHHFSLSTQDQLNLMTLSTLAETQELIPYHADGEICKFYSASEIKQIVAEATQFKIYHTTYYNALKEYINGLDTVEEINAITYGVAIPEEYKSDALKILE